MKLKPIAGYEGIYSIREDGMVRVHDRLSTNGKLYKAKWLKSGKTTGGYHYIPLSKDGVRKNHLIHRLVALHFIDNPDNKPEVNHIDKDKDNNHVDNLEWVTSQENKEHSLCKECTLVSPDGQIFIAYNLREFARLHNLNPSSLSKLVRGIYNNHRGWTKWVQ